MPSILIVDDEPNIRRMVGALLGAEGYEVRDASDAAAVAANVLPIETPPDVITMSHRLIIDRRVDSNVSR